MNPFALFVLAILSPVLLAATLFAPLYGGIALACYVIYREAGKAHPLASHWGDVFYMIDVYSRAFHRWAAHVAQADILTYTLPLLLLPLLGLFLSYWLTSKLSIKLKNILQSGHH